MKGEELTFVMAMDAFIDFFQAKISSRKGLWVEMTTAKELKFPELKVCHVNVNVGMYEFFFFFEIFSPPPRYQKQQHLLWWWEQCSLVIPPSLQ